MTTKVDLGKMMPDAEKRPLDKERTSDGDYTPQLIRTAANRHMTTSKSSSSTSLVPLFLVIILLAGTVFYIHRLEMRVRELEIIFRDMEGSNAFDITAAAAAAQSHSSQSADAVATESTPQPEVTEATTQRSPSLSPIVQLEGNYKDWEFLDDDAAGSGLDAVGYPPSDFHDDGIFSYDLEDDFDTNYEGSGDEPTSTVSSSSSGLKTSSGYLESYMNLLGYKWSEEEQTSRDPISVIHRRRRRSVAEPQPSEKVRDEKRDDEDEFADDDIMMADDAASAARGGSSDDRRTARGRSREGATHEEQPRDRNTDARTKTSSQKPTGVLAANDDSRQSRSRRNKMQYRKSVGRNQPLTSSTTTTVTTPSSGIKVAHFVAPRQDSPFVSKGMPPGTYINVVTQYMCVS
jgi:hypothetical protein